MKTKSEIIEETAKFYNSGNRSTATIQGLEKCRYFYDGKTCAVGRCMEDAEQFSNESGDVESFNYDLGTLNRGRNLDSVLKPEYRGHELKFWKKLQEFHDQRKNWDDKGLTHEGYLVYNQLKETYGDQDA